jgi:hypothetical protein
MNKPSVDNVMGKLQKLNTGELELVEQFIQQLEEKPKQKREVKGNENSS